ncbi:MULTISPECIES: glycoside hydrolase family 15 protein [Burkholderia]|uniref:Trehalase n=4 Tax=Burkholderia TaxID=32008 RepID=A0A107NQ49_BURCE|nr:MULTISPECIES: glycoside hydrolase family 15 protein [Burkholderia]HDR9770487.1 glycoside hydrolase family 15 protein [Burkholderia cepacia ATCC 25416]AOI83228.1 glucoamylase [Burkholderia cepacia]KAB1584083.1 glycoside hydrolase family 15 protein [Burkholderia cepacia]KML13996.1 glucoamylase [Burkholderia cepacia]KML35633.1 glucoamylase [Burkholderia lata]
MPALIEDYALVGDGHTAALVAKDGSVDWLCWPRFDSGACFAALLGTPEHGRWLLAPAADAAITHTSRRYRGDTLILETDYESADGAVTVVDFMPPGNGWSELVRIVIGRHGKMKMRMELVLRFDYGFSIPWVTQLTREDGMKAIAGPDTVVLRTPVPLTGKNLHTLAEFTVNADERVPFSLSYAASHMRLPPARDPLSMLARTENYWLEWSGRCQVQGRYAAAVRRSLITLKALAYEPTGGIVAAPTTSLPEKIGGNRNWDYRYCWLRDATITLLALMRGGYYDEARAWRTWLGRVMAGSPEQIQIMYGIAGERRLPEMELDWLPGYQDSKPVRVGNGAANQLQLDVFGEVMAALHLARVGGLQADDTVWSVQCALLDHLEKIWQEPDEGIWETRGGRRHFTFSKVMAWVAFDRAIKSAEMFRLPGSLDRWRALREQIHADVCNNAWHESKRAFAQSYGSDELDASVLLMPLLGFLPPEDPRIVGTVEAIERELLHDGLVMRYRTTEYDDGLPPGEGTFLACSFWLVDNYALLGRIDDAHRLFSRLLALSNDLGLLAEEYDPVAGRLVGNFPQAFSHVALVHTAMNLMHHEDAMARAAGQPAPAVATGR